jgi:hypothetical protein
VVGQRHTLAALLLGKSRYPLYRLLGGLQGCSGMAEENLTTGIRSPDRPARSESLYRLSYAGPLYWRKLCIIYLATQRRRRVNGVLLRIIYLATQRRRRVDGVLLRIQVVSGPNLGPDSV